MQVTWMQVFAIVVDSAAIFVMLLSQVATRAAKYLPTEERARAAWHLRERAKRTRRAAIEVVSAGAELTMGIGTAITYGLEWTARRHGRSLLVAGTILGPIFLLYNLSLFTEMFAPEQFNTLMPFLHSASIVGVVGVSVILAIPFIVFYGPYLDQRQLWCAIWLRRGRPLDAPGIGAAHVLRFFDWRKKRPPRCQSIICRMIFQALRVVIASLCVLPSVLGQIGVWLGVLLLVFVFSADPSRLVTLTMVYVLVSVPISLCTWRGSRLKSRRATTYRYSQIRHTWPLSVQHYTVERMFMIVHTWGTLLFTVLGYGLGMWFEPDIVSPAFGTGWLFFLLLVMIVIPMIRDSEMFPVAAALIGDGSFRAKQLKLAMSIGFATLLMFLISIYTTVSIRGSWEDWEQHIRLGMLHALAFDPKQGLYLGPEFWLSKLGSV